MSAKGESVCTVGTSIMIVKEYFSVWVEDHWGLRRSQACVALEGWDPWARLLRGIVGWDPWARPV